MAIATINASRIGFSERRSNMISEKPVSNDNVVKASSSLMKPRFIVSLINLNMELRKLEQSSISILHAIERLVFTIKKLNNEMISKFRAIGTEVYMNNKDLMSSLSKINPMQPPPEDDDRDRKDERKGGLEKKPKESLLDKLVKAYVGLKVLKTGIKLAWKLSKGALKLAAFAIKFLLNPAGYFQKWSRAIANTVEKLLKTVGGWGKTFGKFLKNTWTSFSNKWTSFSNKWNKMGGFAGIRNMITDKIKGFNGMIKDAFEKFKTGKFFTNFKAGITTTIEAMKARIAVLYKYLGITMKGAASWFSRSLANAAKSTSGIRGALASGAAALKSFGGAFTGAGAGAGALKVVAKPKVAKVAKVAKGVAKFASKLRPDIISVLALLGEMKYKQAMENLHKKPELLDEFNKKATEMQNAHEQRRAELMEEKSEIADSKRFVKRTGLAKSLYGENPEGTLDPQEWNQMQKRNGEELRRLSIVDGPKLKADLAGLLLNYEKKALTDDSAPSGTPVSNEINKAANVAAPAATNLSSSSTPNQSARTQGGGDKKVEPVKPPADREDKKPAGAPTPAAAAPAAAPAAAAPVPAARPAGSPTPSAPKSSTSGPTPAAAASPATPSRVAPPPPPTKADARLKNLKAPDSLATPKQMAGKGFEENKENEQPNEKQQDLSKLLALPTIGKQLTAASDKTDVNQYSFARDVVVNNNDTETNRSGTIGGPADGGRAEQNMPLMVVHPLFGSLPKVLHADN